MTGRIKEVAIGTLALVSTVFLLFVIGHGIGSLLMKELLDVQSRGSGEYFIVAVLAGLIALMFLFLWIVAAMYVGQLILTILKR